MVHASLFSGIGGPEVAAMMMGWENAFHCEINPFGKAVLDYWFPESKSYDDITKTSFNEWRGKIDVLTGGFPCQPFSYAGKRGGRNDDRYLWPEMLRVIDEIRPTWVVGENVAGITTMVEGGVLTPLGGESSLFEEGNELHGYELDQSFTIERICGDLERLGYSVQPMLIPAAAVGAPHRRDRVFIIAFDADTHRSDDKRGPGEDAGQGKGERVQERNEVRESGVADSVRSKIRGVASNSPCELSNGDSVGNGLQSRAGSSSESGDRHREVVCGLFPENRWAKFPTVSPIHRGNDGIPFPLDNLTIPYSKWRVESLKAYGNAIVPQVMFRIFQTIETAERYGNQG